MGVIEGGVIIIDGIPRPVDPFARVRRVPSASTIQAAVNAADAGDILYIEPGAYVETVTVSKRLTLVGLGGRGAAYIEPTAAGAEGMLINASDVTLINLGVAGKSDSDYALRVNGNGAAKNGKRFRAYGCKFEGPTGTVVLLDGDANYNVSDALFEDCEFAWGGSGILFDDSGYGYPTQIRLRRCWFHNLTAVHVGLAAGGGVVNLELTDCVHDNDEAGAAPTDYIKVDRAGDTGIISGCRFATATNASGVLTIAAGIKWAANATEAGWSTARPA